MKATKIRTKYVAVLMAVAIMLGNAIPVYAASNVDGDIGYANTEEIISKEELDDIMECIETVKWSDGVSEVVDGKFVISCEETSDVAMSIQSYTTYYKTDSRTLTVKILGTDTDAFRFEQSVTYKVATDQSSVEITRHTTSGKALITGYSVSTYQDDVIYNTLLGNYVHADAYYQVNTITGNALVNVGVRAYIDGTRSFYYNAF